jgi:hypothetical protein
VSLYTQRFVAIYNAGGSATFTVPPGKRAIVMSMAMLNTGSVEIGASLTISGTALLAWLSCPGPNKGAYITELRMAVLAGESMVLNLTAPGYATAAGYLLADP